jgi:branched-subunit amino acid transport protein
MTWLAIAGSALATYLVRAFAFKVALPATLPTRVVRYLDALPSAIIAALVGPAVLVPGGTPTHGPELIAAIVVIALVARWRNLLAGVLAGVAAVALLRLVLPA